MRDTLQIQAIHQGSGFKSLSGFDVKDVVSAVAHVENSFGAVRAILTEEARATKIRKNKAVKDTAHGRSVPSYGGQPRREGQSQRLHACGRCFQNRSFLHGGRRCQKIGDAFRKSAFAHI